MKLFTLYADLMLDTSAFDRDVASAKTTGQQLAQSIGADATSIRNAFTNAFAFSVADILADSAQNALGYLADFTGDSITMAANVEQTNEKLKALFGKEGAADIREWAQTTKEQFGISEQAAKQYVADIAGLWGNENIGFTKNELMDMATNLVELTGDLASFNNFTVQETWTKIISGMRGQTEAIEDLGIDLRANAISAYYGMSENTWGQLDQRTRYLKTYEYALAMTTHAQGDFARTGDSYQNQLAEFNANIEELKASLGDDLLPVMTQLVTWFNDLFGSQENVSDSMDDLTGDFMKSYSDIATTTTNALALINALDELSASTEDAASSEMWNALLTDLKQTLPGIGKLISDETGKIEGGTKALQEYVREWESAHRQIAVNAVMQDMLQIVAQESKDVANLEFELDSAQILSKNAENEIQRIYESARERLGLAEDVDSGHIYGEIITAAAEGDIQSQLDLQNLDTYGAADERVSELESQLAFARAELQTAQDRLDAMSDRVTQMLETSKAESTERFGEEEPSLAAAINALNLRLAEDKAPQIVNNFTVMLDGQEIGSVVVPIVERQFARDIGTKAR